MSKKSKPGDGTSGKGVKGGGVYGAGFASSVDLTSEGSIFARLVQLARTLGGRKL
jgi:hypothetical protein